MIRTFFLYSVACCCAVLITMLNPVSLSHPDKDLSIPFRCDSLAKLLIMATLLFATKDVSKDGFGGNNNVIKGLLVLMGYLGCAEASETSSVSGSFAMADYFVFVGMLVVSFAIGVYHALRSSASNDEYLRPSIGVVPMAISLCASFNSAYMILGIPAEIYAYGTLFYLMIVGTAVGVLVAAEIWIPVLYRLHIVSMYEYFELRFSSKLPRLLMSLIFILKTSLYIGIVLYAPTIALSAVTPLHWSTCILLLGVSSTLYTSLGGMKAVVWTDVFQIFIVFFGIVAILVQGASMVDGGIEGVFDAAQRGRRLQELDFSLDLHKRHTVFNMILGTLVVWGSPYTCSQYLVQRCCCLPSLNQAKLALYLNLVGQILMVSLVALVGLVLYAVYETCDPVLAGIVEKRDAVIPLFVITQFVEHPGVAGVFVACLFSGALSTLDSALNALAAVTWEELKHFSVFKSITKRNENHLTKLLSVLYGALAVAIAFLCNNMGSLINVGSRLFGACMGPMFGLCLCSVLVPFVNLRGAISGLVIGQIANIALSFGAVVYAPMAKTLELSTSDCSAFGVNATSNDFGGTGNFGDNDLDVLEDREWWTNIFLLSYNWYPVMGLLLTCVCIVVISACSGGNPELSEADAKYFHPVAWSLYKAVVGETKLSRENNDCIIMAVVNNKGEKLDHF